MWMAENGSGMFWTDLKYFWLTSAASARIAPWMSWRAGNVPPRQDVWSRRWRAFQNSGPIIWPSVANMFWNRRLGVRFRARSEYHLVSFCSGVLRCALVVIWIIEQLIGTTWMQNETERSSKLIVCEIESGIEVNSKCFDEGIEGKYFEVGIWHNLVG